MKTSLLKKTLLASLLLPMLAFSAADDCAPDDYCVTFINNLDNHDLHYSKAQHKAVLPGINNKGAFEPGSVIQSKVVLIPDENNTEGMSTSGFINIVDVPSVSADFFGVNIDTNINHVALHGELMQHLPYYVKFSENCKQVSVEFSRTAPDKTWGQGQSCQL